MGRHGQAIWCTGQCLVAQGCYTLIKKVYYKYFLLTVMDGDETQPIGASPMKSLGLPLPFLLTKVIKFCHLSSSRDGEEWGSICGNGKVKTEGGAKS